jgi:3-oxoadipate enol-lactonase
MSTAPTVITTSGHIPVDGGRIYYESIGQGQPVVLLHAGIAHLRMWDDQIPALAERFRAIRYDLRGFGRSSLPSASFSHVADLLAVLDTLGLERAHLLGCSKGAGLCLDFALAHPDRVRSLVLVAGAPSGFEGTAGPPRQWEETVAAFKAGDFERAAELETQIWLDGASRTPDQLDSALRDRVRAMDRQALEHEAENSAHEQPEAPNAVERLGEVRVPVLVLVGDLDDPDLLAAGRLMAERLPSAQYAVIRGTAHLPNLEQPAEFNRLVLDFLTGLQ